eukprot:TRINITY_DN11850_c0_g1_i2.p1 TRINITY_DN11850_c0_g1~~TRINITY_DN11850_c0_g1_i2.p1  ORF type:complete len:102 (+),score=23.97 TRINITY_DN11850_c0_g1_i2:42-308(+)
MAGIAVTVKNSSGEVLATAEDLQGVATIADVIAKMPAPPEGHVWSLFDGSVKMGGDMNLSDIGEGEITLQASYSTVAEKAAKEKDEAS